MNHPLERLRYHVTGAIERGERQPIIAEPRMDKARIVADLMEIRYEIARINRTAGETLFNPSATAAVDGLIRHFTKGR